MSSVIDLLWPDTGIGQFFNTIIFVLTIVFLIPLLRRGAVLRNERGVLTTVENALRGATVDPSEPRSTPIADFTALGDICGLGKVDPGNSPTSFTGKRILAVWRLRGMGRSAVETVNAVQDFKQSLGLETPRYITSILVLIGLAGTVSSLHGIIGQINMSLGGSGNSLGDSMSQLVSAFAPMKSAFSCTLAGIIGSVILAYTLTRVETNETSLAADLDETVLLYVLPLVFPSSETAQFQHMTDLIVQSETSVKRFAETIGQSRDFFAETLGEAVRGAAKELSSSIESATSALNGSLDDMRGSSSAIAESSATVLRYRQQLEVERQQVLDYLRESSDRLINLGDKVLTPLGEASASLVEGRKGVEELSTKTLEGLLAVTGRLEAVVSSIKSTEATLSSIETAVVSSSTSFTQGAEAMERRSIENLGEYTRHLNIVAGGINMMLDRLRPELISMPNGKLMGDTLRDVSTGLSDLSAQMKDSIVFSSESLAQQRDLNAVLQRIAAGDRSNDVANLNKDQVRLLTSALETIQTSLREIRSIHQYIQTPLWKQMLRLNEADVRK